MLHMARYENGAEEGVMLAFRQLGGYGDTLAGLNQLDDQTLWKLLRENQFTKAPRRIHLRSSWPGRRSGRCRENTARTCGRRFRRSCGPCCSMRAYSSRCTYHCPAGVEGRRMYSELWVDPDAEEAGGGPGVARGRT